MQTGQTRFCVHWWNHWKVDNRLTMLTNKPFYRRKSWWLYYFATVKIPKEKYTMYHVWNILRNRFFCGWRNTSILFVSGFTKGGQRLRVQRYSPHLSWYLLILLVSNLHQLKFHPWCCPESWSSQSHLSVEVQSWCKAIQPKVSRPWPPDFCILACTLEPSYQWFCILR